MTEGQTLFIMMTAMVVGTLVLNFIVSLVFNSITTKIIIEHNVQLK